MKTKTAHETVLRALTEGALEQAEMQCLDEHSATRVRGRLRLVTTEAVIEWLRKEHAEGTDKTEVVYAPLTALVPPMVAALVMSVDTSTQADRRTIANDLGAIAADAIFNELQAIREEIG